MRTVAERIPGYTFGDGSVARSPLSLPDLERLKQSVGFTAEDEQHLRTAGAVLAGQAKELVDHWRGIVASTPHLAPHLRTLDGQPIERYSLNSGLRFQKWVLDTCLRPYDQDWLNYQQEIALRHTSVKKNRVDDVKSTPFVPLRDFVGFIAIINDTVKPYLAARGHSPPEVEQMHGAWCRSMQLQAVIWAEPYADAKRGLGQW